VRVQKAEDAGIGGERLWRPVLLGLRPQAPSPALRSYLAGEFLTRS
jgi:hypothetical protein